ncbi:MAG: hypothetical protein DWQ34_07750 [Planctomycetota bacterium]|nr:MAG: hypothetical protein DWQ34_07750 [Planctomycetota bacterium]REK21461.1 MAG: hypothetical protein DWQ41_21765 [Planctomycetota bacterium]REK40027.1 MAG: hypothetical protein DWQ45_00280 [Planctomycetota bacterium]
MSDAAIATQQLGHGRLIPLLIIDTSERPDIDELVRVHEHFDSGDCSTVWSRLDKKLPQLGLVCEFSRPSELSFVIRLDVTTRSGIIDQIVTGNAVYFQPGRTGDRLATTLKNPRLLIQVPDTGFQREWERIFLRQSIRHLRSRGMSRKQAKKAGPRFIEEWRRLGQLQIN